MSTTSVETSLNISPSFEYSIVWTDDTIATIQSHAPLDANTKYTVTLNTNAKSADGISLSNELEFSFIPTLMNSPALLGKNALFRTGEYTFQSPDTNSLRSFYGYTIG
ncbi:Ig-like domain-containing protein [Chloroflexota bacterium]